jgi:D-beta-D-heptose 7-phosphate kinase/D-beta-D-heptose 1-phosphate adenosyltransferase
MKTHTSHNKRVWINGAFDILHIGHLRILKHGATLGHLRVGIDGDDRIKKLKGPQRPFNNFETRKEFLSSLRFVDEVVRFDSEEELVEQIKLYKPDIMVIGSDYKDKRIVGAEHIGKIVYFDRTPHSTTEILEYGRTTNN